MKPYQYKTWLEINKSALLHNIAQFRKLLGKNTRLWFVTKSNAYGHGITTITSLAAGKVDGFCADSVAEGRRLREHGIKKPILILGATLPRLYPLAAKHNLILTISNKEQIFALHKAAKKPLFHLKIDSGMHWQGFYREDLPQTIKLLQKFKLLGCVCGIYTHFASAKDCQDKTFTQKQFEDYIRAAEILSNTQGVAKNFLRHAAATGATLLDSPYHLDMVRVGIGLYGLWPSEELKQQLGKKVFLQPVLSWHSVISEIKNAKKGDYVGYDQTEKLSKNSTLAVIPIGYWHGYDRGLSGIGEVIINGRKARVTGRISMDMLVVDVTTIPCKTGDEVILIGKNGKQEITAAELAKKIATTHYEVVTRINPLIKKVVV